MSSTRAAPSPTAVEAPAPPLGRRAAPRRAGLVPRGGRRARGALAAAAAGRSATSTSAASTRLARARPPATLVAGGSAASDDARRSLGPNDLCWIWRSSIGATASDQEAAPWDSSRRNREPDDRHRPPRADARTAIRTRRGARRCPCPDCAGRGYLDHIDPFQEIMYLHCTQCDAQVRAHQGRARARRFLGLSRRARAVAVPGSRSLSGPWPR